MFAVFTRSALVHWGFQPGPEIAALIRDYDGDHYRTWADVMRERRKEQTRILRNKRQSEEWHPAKLWVAYFDQAIFGGWQCMIESLRERAWVDRDRPALIPELLRMFPSVLAFNGPTQRDTWEAWKPAFAAAHRRRTHHRKPRGVVYLWWSGGNEASLSNPQIRFGGLPSPPPPAPQPQLVEVPP